MYICLERSEITHAHAHTAGQDLQEEGSNVEAGDVEAGDVEAGDVEAGDVEAND